MSVSKKPGQTTVVIQYYSLSWFFETDVRSKMCMLTYHSDYRCQITVESKIVYIIKAPRIVRILTSMIFSGSPKQYYQRTPCVIVLLLISQGSVVAEDDDPWSAKRSGFQRSRSLDVTMMDTLSKYGGGSQSGYVHRLYCKCLRSLISL